MSGHSKWSTIKRKKEANDAKRGKVFTRLAREIAIAAREGGGDPNVNFTLRLAVDRAKASNMPNDNIDRAIKRGTGESKDGSSFEQITYEGYAPHGVALIIEVVTDNRNRAVADIRHVLTHANGSLGETGSVMWQFTRKAYFAFPNEGADTDAIFELAVEAGADDVDFDEEFVEITGNVEAYKGISDTLAKGKIKPQEAELRMFPNQEMELDPGKTLQVMKVIEDLEDLDDVQNVYSNLKISDEAIEQLEVA
jgi:YebC/PmpR family DNA-binding regulatory protein